LDIFDTPQSDNTRLSDRILNRAKEIFYQRYGKRQDISQWEKQSCVNDAAQEIRREDAERRRKAGIFDTHTGHVQGRW